MNKEIEEGNNLSLDFTKLSQIGQAQLNVIPVVVQNELTQAVIMIGYVNAEALAETQRSGYAVFFSTSRNELWRKGATSGDRLKIVEIRVNCEQNSLLYKVIPEGKGACHTQRVDGTSRGSCFYRVIDDIAHLTLDPNT